jgi:hypothetical protein
MPPSGSTNSEEELFNFCSEEELFNFWLTVRTPLHPGSRPLPRKLWSVKSGIRIPLQSLLRRFPLQCLERQRKQNRTLLLLIGRHDLSLFERKVLYKRPTPVTPRFWTHCVILL